jgi:hypothetical protein
MLLAGTVDGRPDVKIDARLAAIIGASFAVTLFALRRILGR